jgi:hypothetical protein
VFGNSEVESESDIATLKSDEFISLSYLLISDLRLRNYSVVIRGILYKFTGTNFISLSIYS